MRLLLDTDALLWQLSLSKSSSFGKNAKDLMESADEICVSSISIVEMQIKTMLGKLNAPEDCTAVVSGAGNTLLPFLPQMGDQIKKYPQLVRHDPFDRMILAHAGAAGLTLLTSDRVLLGLGLDYVTNAKK